MRIHFHAALLRAAALLVPAPERREWLAEWQGELGYVQQALRAPQVTAFCLGAFRDALWLRRNSPPRPAGQSGWLRSPWHCLAFLGALAALSLFCAFHLPAVGETLFPRSYPGASDLVTISKIPVRDYQLLVQDSNLFSALAFYRPMPMRVQPPLPDGAEPTVALSSRNLFAMLQLPVGSPVNPRAAALVLTGSAWRKYFDSDPDILGREMEVDGALAEITAILPDRSWLLPGRMDAWLLADESRFTSLSDDTRGFVLGRVTTPITRIAVPHQDDESHTFPCIALSAPQPFLALVLMAGVVCLLLPIFANLSLGEYPARGHLLPRATKMRRWFFLGAKITLLLPIILCGSLTLVGGSLTPQALVVSSIFGFHWVWADQRKRCPVCLRVLEHPTAIGEASRTFLEWYGTEFVCAKGHGLLHVPEIANSYSARRWMNLDSSWSSLFS